MMRPYYDWSCRLGDRTQARKRIKRRQILRSPEYRNYSLLSCNTPGMALFLRPKTGHKLSLYWNIYHHAGYAVAVLGILNVFKGLAILSPASKWRSAYIIIISFFGCY